MRFGGSLALLAVAACQASDPAPGASTASPSQGGVKTEHVSFSESELARIRARSPLPPAPGDPTNAVYENEDAARLGQFLFHDERLSKTGTTSCASCHDPDLAWGDGKALGEGVTRLDRNSMSIWNVAHNRWFFWDGRADSLWAQALIPLEHALEHASSRLQIAHVIHDDAELRGAYEALFGELPDLSDMERFPPVGRPVTERELGWIEELSRRRQEAGLAPVHTHLSGAHFIHPHQRAWGTMSTEDQDAVTRIFTNVGKSIAAFERLIVAGNSPFDEFVEGLATGDPEQLAALDASSQRGLKLFVGRARCHICHQGPAFTDLEFHDIGIPPSDEVETRDLGRAEGLVQLKENPFNGIGPWSDDPDGRGRERIAFLPAHPHGAGPEFKTPSLRNVALTAPYMHQGQIPTLRGVLEHYSTVSGTLETILVPMDFTPGETDDLIRFLESLTDTAIDPSLTARPTPRRSR